MKQPWKEQHWREQVGSLLEGDQYILDEAELWGALFLGSSTGRSSIPKYNGNKRKSISRLRSQYIYISYIFLNYKFRF